VRARVSKCFGGLLDHLSVCLGERDDGGRLAALHSMQNSNNNITHTTVHRGTLLTLHQQSVPPLPCRAVPLADWLSDCLSISLSTHPHEPLHLTHLTVEARGTPQSTTKDTKRRENARSFLSVFVFIVRFLSPMGAPRGLGQEAHLHEHVGS